MFRIAERKTKALGKLVAALAVLPLMSAPALAQWGPGPVVPSADSEYGEAITACQKYGLNFIKLRDPAAGAERLILGPDSNNRNATPNLQGQTLFGNAMLSGNDGWQDLTFQCQLSTDFETVRSFNFNFVGHPSPWGSPGFQHGDDGGNGDSFQWGLGQATQMCTAYGLNVVREQDAGSYPNRLELGPTQENPNARPKLDGSVLEGSGMMHGAGGWQDLTFECRLSPNHGYVQSFDYRLDRNSFGGGSSGSPWGSRPGPTPSPTFSEAVATCQSKGLEVVRRQWWGGEAKELIIGETQSGRTPPQLSGNELTGLAMAQTASGAWRDMHFQCALSSDLDHAYSFHFTLQP